jgi:hypothetical protein
MREIDQTVKDVLIKVARMMESDIRRNIPRKGTMPNYFESTGNLKNSLRVNVDSRGDAIEVEFASYGKFTAFGTRQYRDDEAAQDTFFGMKAPRIYKKGKGGIRPQYWLSLRNREDRYNDFIQKNLQIGLDKFIENYLYDRI